MLNSFVQVTIWCNYKLNLFTVAIQQFNFGKELFFVYQFVHVGKTATASQNSFASIEWRVVYCQLDNTLLVTKLILYCFRCVPETADQNHITDTHTITLWKTERIDKIFPLSSVSISIGLLCVPNIYGYYHSRITSFVCYFFVQKLCIQFQRDGQLTSSKFDCDISRCDTIVFRQRQAAANIIILKHRYNSMDYCYTNCSPTIDTAKYISSLCIVYFCGYEKLCCCFFDRVQNFV